MAGDYGWITPVLTTLGGVADAFTGGMSGGAFAATGAVAGTGITYGLEDAEAQKAALASAAKGRDMRRAQERQETLNQFVKPPRGTGWISSEESKARVAGGDLGRFRFSPSPERPGRDWRDRV